MRHALTVTLTVLALLASLPPAARAGDEETVKKEADVKAQYAAAALLHKQITGKKGDERRAAQQKAAAAFEAVALHFPEEAPTAGRALYRAAELYEVLRDREKAVGCLNRVLGMQAEDVIKARAHNLLGHIYRRAKNLPDALKEYQTVVSAHAKAQTEVVEALGWIGKCRARLGDQTAAREAWRSLPRPEAPHSSCVESERGAWD